RGWLWGWEDAQAVLIALACFSSPSDSGSPSVLLDHAIMIELVSRDLHHDLDAYRDFCKSRDTYDKRHAQRAERDRWLQERRGTLQERMHKKRRRDLDGAAGGLRKVLTVLGL